MEWLLLSKEVSASTYLVISKLILCWVQYSLLFESQEFEQRVQNHNRSHGSHEHWLNHGPFQRSEPQQVLGGHLVGKDR